MLVYQIIAVVIFVLGYIGITAEHKLDINKSGWALFAGGALWVIVALANPSIVEEHLVHTGSEIFSITMFLLAAMSLVEILLHTGFFDYLRTKILAKKMSNKGQLLTIMSLAFLLSAVVDNLTATIIVLQIARKFFKGENLLVAAVAIVIAANAGGAFSPIGDVTTIMLWIAGKFSASQIMARAVLPAVAIFIVAHLLLRRKIKEEADDTAQVKPVEKLCVGKKIIICTTFLSFFFPLGAKFFHLPPVIGILFGLGLTWIVVEVVGKVGDEESGLSTRIEELIQKTDIASIKFFVGILLAVSALQALGILQMLSGWIYGEAMQTKSIIIGNVAIGMISAVLDNIPLTAIAINMLETTNTNLWVLLAITVGTGGSLLAIGSAAGVVAMGLVKELSFKKYFQIGFFPALISFFAGVAIWLIDYALF